jgi:hypothetical protein
MGDRESWVTEFDAQGTDEKWLIQVSVNWMGTTLVAHVVRRKGMAIELLAVLHYLSKESSGVKAWNFSMPYPYGFNAFELEVIREKIDECCLQMLQ